MKTILLFLVLISFNLSAQFLSLPKDKVISILKESNLKFIQIEDSDNNFISISNFSGCKCLLEFDKNNICRQEILIASSDMSVVNLIADLNEKYYIRLNDKFFHEEEYGLVEVTQDKSTFTFQYE